ncbi:MAG TPA: class E sortase, partial [Acidimicrobiales bacterium]|nr:class E sortase [Acidimicrobiales bacterium]
LVLLFVVYLLFGTGLTTAGHQATLRRQLAPQLAPAGAPDRAPGPPPVPGGAIGLLQIPAIQVDKAIVQGVGEGDLRRGPGHYPATPLPGQPGNSGIAGHRTTYGAPFYRLNELHAGDRIGVWTRQGRFTYRVQRVFVVQPNDIAVLGPTPRPELTLTTCNPRYSAAQRLIVQADLVGPAAPATPVSHRPGAARPPSAPTIGVVGGQGAWARALGWGLVLVAAAAGSWVLARLWRRRTGTRWWALTYLAATPVCLAVLFLFFRQVSLLLPPSL